jgi:hypothetical protein
MGACDAAAARSGLGCAGIGGPWRVAARSGAGCGTVTGCEPEHRPRDENACDFFTAELLDGTQAYVLPRPGGLERGQARTPVRVTACPDSHHSRGPLCLLARTDYNSGL